MGIIIKDQTDDASGIRVLQAVEKGVKVEGSDLAEVVAAAQSV
jgi:hypothetical protein